MDVSADVSSRVLDFVFKQMLIDAHWSVRRSNAITWWPHRLAQRIWAEPVRTEAGFAISKIHSETDLLKNVPSTDKTYALLALANSTVTLSRYVYDGHQKKIKLACCAYFHAGTIGWQENYFTQAVALQTAQAHTELDSIVELFGCPADESTSPSGFRSEPDDMLNVLEVYRLQGASPSTFVGQECIRLQNLPPGTAVMANSDAGGATVEFAFPGCVPSTAMLRVLTDVSHPKLGSGAFLLLKIPVIPGIAQHVELVNHLNSDELNNWTRGRCFGGWCKDVENEDPLSGVAYVCFIPSTARMDGLLENEVQQMAFRVRWLHEYLHVPDDGPDDVPLRLEALKRIARNVNKG